MKGENSLGEKCVLHVGEERNIKAKPFEGFAFDLFDV